MTDILKHWDLVSFFIGLLIAFVTMRVNLKNLTGWLKSVEFKVQALEGKIIELEKKQSAQIVINEGFEKSLDEIKAMVKDIYEIVLRLKKL